jgi:hypothetical protein
MTQHLPLTHAAFRSDDARHRALLGAYVRVVDALEAEAARMRALDGEQRWADGLASIARLVDTVGARHLRSRTGGAR